MSVEICVKKRNTEHGDFVVQLSLLLSCERQRSDAEEKEGGKQERTVGEKGKERFPSFLAP